MTGRVAFIADVHIGNARLFSGDVFLGMNVRCRQRLACLKNAVAAAIEEKCEALVVCGDLLDGVRTDPRMIAATAHILSDIPTIILRGNHEMVSQLPGDSSISALLSAATIVDQNMTLRVGGVEIVFVPYQTGLAVGWLDEACEYALAQVWGEAGDRSAPRVLALHLGLSDAQTPYYLDGAPDSISAGDAGMIARKHKCSHVMAGNWHRRKQWNLAGVAVTQIGALCPTGFNNPGLDGYGGVAILDPDGTITWREIAGPRFLRVSGVEDLFDVSDTLDTDSGDVIYVSAAVSIDDLQAAEVELGALIESGVITDGIVEVSREDAAEVLSEAVTAAERAADYEKAVREYAARVAPKDVDADRVAEMAIDFLSQRNAERVREALERRAAQ